MPDDRNFIPALLDLRNASIDDVIERMHKLFTHIGGMSAREVVAAFQTIEASARQVPALQREPLLVDLLEALRLRMVAITETPEGWRSESVFCEVVKKHTPGIPLLWKTSAIEEFCGNIK